MQPTFALYIRQRTPTGAKELDLVLASGATTA